MRAPPRWCRQVTAAAAVAGIAVGLCATFPPLELLEPIQDASDETGRPPVGHPKHPLSAIPPLPVAEDITALASFLVTNVDDATEDAVKAACLLGCASIPPLLGLAATPRLALSSAMVAAAYAPCDRLGDSLGDGTEALQLLIRSRFGLPPKPPPPPPPKKHVPAFNYVDDVVEDLSKAACLYLHAQVGSLLGDALVAPLFGALPGVPGAAELGWATSWLVRPWPHPYTPARCGCRCRLTRYVSTGDGSLGCGSVLRVRQLRRCAGRPGTEPDHHLLRPEGIR